MSIITAALLCSVTDSAMAYAKSVIGSGSYGYVQGAIEAQAIVDALLGATDLDPVIALGSSSRALLLDASGVKRAAADLSPLLLSLQQHVISYSIADVRTLDTYLSYLNVLAGGTWTALQAPLWKQVIEAWNPGQVVRAENLYYEVLSPASANGLRKLVVGTGQTAGVTIATDYAGGFPQLRVSGLTGSGDVTVTGTAFDRATRQAATGRTWTATVSADGVTALAPGGATPAGANALIRSVSDVAAAGGISAGTIIAEAARPSGRPAL